jgi:uncharacterized protein (TIGR03663 family)
MRPGVGILALGIGLVAVALRVPKLAERPMHADEAILADKFGTLLETGSYRYDPSGYHGPALIYLTLLPAWLRGSRTYAGLSESLLRVVPVFFGVALVLMPLLLAKGLGQAAALAAAALTAVSPAMVFYSRYYIPEMLLVCFCFGVIAFAYRYAQTRAVIWALLAGACAGLAYATKETAVIALGAMVLAMALAGVRKVPALPAIAALIVGLLIAVLFLSSFFSNPGGVADSLRAYWTTYLDRAIHETRHIHPWHYYAGLLVWDGLPLWSEAVILVLACVGLIAATRLAWVRFLGAYAVILMVSYSLIPYKTPWCLLGFWQGLILLAGVGAAALLRWLSRRWGRVLTGAFLAAGGLHLAWQAWLAAGPYSADPRNPYVYAHTGRDVYVIRDRLEALAKVHPDGHNLSVQVFSAQNLWPLPWYLRSFTHVRWWRAVPDTEPPAPVILASPNMEVALARKLYELPPPGERELYMRLFDRPIELRPQVEVRGYLAKSLWDKLRRTID